MGRIQARVWSPQMEGTFESLRLDFLLLVAYFTFFYAATWRINVDAVQNHTLDADAAKQRSFLRWRRGSKSGRATGLSCSLTSPRPKDTASGGRSF
ncbi:unnamed protein product [Symbiodinium sp. KB8]|nr:unnamed protein product [Symbiodinium sp. KB8]